MTLNLTPNEILGYRIQPDWHSMNVVLVKRHGPTSKNAGQEYPTTLAYCKNVEFALAWIFNHALGVEGSLSQKEQEQISGSVADAKALLAACAKATELTLAAAAELQTRIDRLALSKSALVIQLGENVEAS